MAYPPHEHHRHHYHHNRLRPCLHCQPQSYIRMVQHLIERCMCFRMTMEDCITALSRHADIQPVVTLTVWRELLKENRSFFRAYNSVVSSPTQSPADNPRIAAGRRSGRHWR